ncbi:hypothetical protein QBC34DRAFT_358082 [Podospora aff. communis PSN243]|uniref:Myb-like domain-containing protein n=1 Tax=Podospora aff. communis PSN243 TaxID=3040156 RepID=A0AAV9GAW7_9PEZI|nr:hypothetical protein QBC34DRAFT_358082 [Podospora aff. communis PSN243]
MDSYAVDLPTPHRASPSGWNAEDDRVLIELRATGKNWNQIQREAFPGKTGDACRKRYERLMERHSINDFEKHGPARIAGTLDGGKQESPEAEDLGTSPHWYTTQISEHPEVLRSDDYWPQMEVHNVGPDAIESVTYTSTIVEKTHKPEAAAPTEAASSSTHPTGERNYAIRWEWDEKEKDYTYTTDDGVTWKYSDYQRSRGSP